MTMPTRYVRGPDGQWVAVPEPITPPEEEEAKEEEVEPAVEPAVEPTVVPAPPPAMITPTPTPIPVDDGLSDLFEAPKKEDMSDLMGVTDETEVSNEDVMGEEEEDPGMTEEDEEALFGVSEEDVMGEAPEARPKPAKPKLRRTIKRYPPPPTTLGRMR